MDFIIWRVNEMRSSFWHIGVNKSLENQYKDYGWRAPRIHSDGSIDWCPLPDHNDPDFNNLTYGEPWGRIDSLRPGDVAFFIESATTNEWKTWAYYLVAVFVTEEVYHVEAKQTPCTIEALIQRYVGKVDRSAPLREHALRVRNNAHWIREDPRFSVLLGEKAASKILFQKPIKISEAQDPLPGVKRALNFDLNRKYVGYWWKKWFDDRDTRAMLAYIDLKERVKSN